MDNKKKKRKYEQGNCSPERIKKKNKKKITRKKTDSSPTTVRSTSQLKLLAKRSLLRIL